ncbi:cupin domain-containing protein [Streptomyces sp. NPDC054841]
MASPSGPGVLARLADLLADDASAERGGALWRLAEGGRQLDANVVRLPPDAGIGEHVEPDLDVLLYVAAGSGLLDVDGVRHEVTAGSVVWLPHGSRRALRAGPEGLVQLSVHRRRPGLVIKSAGGAADVDRPTDFSGLEVASPDVDGWADVDGSAQEGGEAPCLLDRVCPECGRLAAESDARYCGRCGERLPGR